MERTETSASYPGALRMAALSRFRGLLCLRRAMWLWNRRLMWLCRSSASPCSSVSHRSEPVFPAPSSSPDANGTAAHLVRSICVADDGRVLLCEECHSQSDFCLIFSDDRLQEGKKFPFLLRIVLRVVYVAANQPHEFHIVHTNAIPSPA